MTKTVAIRLGLFAAFVAGGCYNTLNVKNGGLVCGPNDACPDGFQCIKDSQAGHCWKNGTGPDAGGTGSDTTTVKTDVANPLACTVADATPPFGPFPTDKCSAVDQAVPGTCDPVCQAGCACDRRCVVNTTTYASFECEDSAQAPSGFVPVQGTCSSDASKCAPGSVCINDEVCPYLCFRTCRKDIDCPSNSRCSVLTLLDKTSQPVPNVFLCTPPIENCSPAGAANCATTRTDFNCVFLAGLTGLGTTDSTVCDCRTSHNQAVGASCATLPDDCVPGAVCVDGTCRQICDRQATGTACPGVGVCNPLYGSTRYGYCTR